MVILLLCWAVCRRKMCLFHGEAFAKTDVFPWKFITLKCKENCKLLGTLGKCPRPGLLTAAVSYPCECTFLARYFAAIRGESLYVAILSSAELLQIRYISKSCNSKRFLPAVLMHWIICTCHSNSHCAGDRNLKITFDSNLISHVVFGNFRIFCHFFHIFWHFRKI